MIGKILQGIVSVSKCMCVTRSRDDGERFQGIYVCVGEIQREEGNVSKGENFYSLDEEEEIILLEMSLRNPHIHKLQEKYFQLFLHLITYTLSKTHTQQPKLQM